MKVLIEKIVIGIRFRQDVGDLSSLVKSIQEIDLLHPIVVDSDFNLIAGYRRLKAVKQLGWNEVEVNMVDLKDLARGEFDENFIRKDFTPSEWVAIKRHYEPQLSDEAKERMLSGKPSSKLDEGRTDSKIASFVGIGKDTLRSAEVVVEAAEKEPEKYGKLLQKVDADEVSVSSAERQIKRNRLIEELKEKQKTLQPINGLYEVIVIDPPYPLGFDYDPEHWRGACPYPEMTLDEIKAIKLPMAENCVVWLWTTNSFLHEAYHILEAWQLEPKTVLTWAKDRFGLGVWLRGQTEHCIMAIKGKPKINLTNQTTLLKGKVHTHSQKPEEFYILVDSLCFGTKLDYFGRKEREGWFVYGTKEQEH